MKKIVIITACQGVFLRTRECLIEWFEIGAVRSTCPEEAGAAIRCEKPDIVLIDPCMPKGPGVSTPRPDEISLEIIKQARQDGFNGDFILLFGWEDKKIREAFEPKVKTGIGRFEGWSDHEEKLKKILFSL